MKNLALALLLATAAVAWTTVTTASGLAPRDIAAMACCDDPPPPCWPTGQCDDRQNPPDGGSNRGDQR
jgi:hypothetical protein